MGRDYLSIKKYRVQRKRDLIDCLGGKCARCGYDKCIHAIDFHHIDPEAKDFTVAQKIRNLRQCLEEIQKCVLLCAICHREFHADVWSLDEIEIPKFVDVITDRIGRRFKECKYCHKRFRRKHQNKYCSQQCRSNAAKKVAHPSKETLQTLIDSDCSWVSLGKKFGVSDNAVKKWAKGYGLTIPKRR
jgi:hypothetical protein